MSNRSRSFVPRSRESVTGRQLEAPANSSTGFPGDHYLNPNLKNAIVLRVDSFEGGRTVFRIWNMLDPENPTTKLLSGRLSSLDVSGLGGMSISSPVVCASFVGVNPKHHPMVSAPGMKPATCSYIISRVTGSGRSGFNGIEYSDLPYVSLYNMSLNAHKAGIYADGRTSWDSRWNSLFTAKFKALPAPRVMYFAVGHVYENGEDLNTHRQITSDYVKGEVVKKSIPREGIPYGLGANDPLVVIPLSGAAGKKLLGLCCREKPGWNGQTSDQDPNLPYLYRDPCGIYDEATHTSRGGVIFTLYNPKKLKIEQNTTFSGNTDSEFQSYEVAVSSSYTSAPAAGGSGQKYSPSMSSEECDLVLARHVFMMKDSEADPIDSYLLHEPSIEERCVWLARAFRPIPQLLEFGWMAHPEYLEFPEVHKILTAAVSVQSAGISEQRRTNTGTSSGTGPLRRSEPAPRANAARTAPANFDEPAPFDADADETFSRPMRSSAPIVDTFDEADAPPARSGAASPRNQRDFAAEEFGSLPETAGDVAHESFDSLADESPVRSAHSERSHDFDSFDDEADMGVAEEAMNRSLAKAAQLARARANRRS